MALAIYWTDEAVQTYNNIINYLSFAWPEKVTLGFVKKVQKILGLLEAGNVNFRAIGKRNIYEVLITKHNLLIYRVKTTHIELLGFYDTRQHPRKKKH